MGFRIRTNTLSMMASQNLKKANQELSKGLEQLSSGKRINRSVDDSAGLAIAEKLNAKKRAMQQVKRNANDGVSLLQTAEGGLNEMTNMVIRMRELTSQAASDTIGQKERSYLDQEFNALRKEVQRIQAETEFNGLRVLTEDFEQELYVQVGTGLKQEGVELNPEHQVIKINDLEKVKDFSTAISDLEPVTITGESGQELDGGTPEEIYEVLDKSLETIADFRASLGALQSRFDSTLRTMDVGIENVSAAKSRVEDVDYADATAKLTQARIMTTASTATLSHANMAPEVVLKLLV